MDLARFKKKPLMGIVRGISRDTIEPLVETAAAAGLETLELAINTSSPFEIISAMVETSRGRLMIGAGTVLNLDQLKAALSAGATFIVSPVLIPDVVTYCRKNSIPVFPGAFTPAEIYQAWQAGASMVKVFPAKVFGPSYFKEVKGPFNDIDLLACGGITAENMKEYFSSGASAAAFGASIFKKEWLARGRFDLIENSLRTLVKALPAH
ncbi:MAG: bifunctional 4-hydroxy-2-oxoglutarate aldolase/2-dehydro-3-deoxy-phosphogluconate aldolase [Chitinispirillaceae bacterium]|nr:bifunctional 4-hydroxy-2-oxoglutarate aldolase/2-dehydro-3-deoxy-phosphogluconate aldolase [Chitinispirillaceae bacterium]